MRQHTVHHLHVYVDDMGFLPRKIIAMKDLGAIKIKDLFLSFLLPLALFCDYYNPQGECEWHYKPCGAPCMKTCNNPSGKCLHELRGLEGKHNYAYLILFIKR